MRNYLALWRKEARLTQQNVAGRLGISTQYYQLIESGQRQVKMDLLLAAQLAGLFGRPLEALFEQEARYQALRKKTRRAQGLGEKGGANT